MSHSISLQNNGKTNILNSAHQHGTLIMSKINSY